MKRRTFFKLGGAAALGSALAACGGGGDHAAAPEGPGTRTLGYGTVTGWTETALQAVRSAKPGPPMAARSFAILYTCMYNAWCAYDGAAQPTLSGLMARRPQAERTAANKAMAMSYAAHAALADQYPGERAAFDAYLRRLGYALPSTTLDPATPAGLGLASARAEIAYCHTDGANQLGDLAPAGLPYADYTGYVARNPPIEIARPTPLASIPYPDRWQPLSYTDAGGAPRTPGYLGAHWAQVRPFALRSSDQFRPGPPARYGSPEFVEQTRHVVDVQAALTPEQKVAAEYWADGPSSELPPGHWLMFAVYVSERDRHSDDEDIRMFFALSNALADAAIAAWDGKGAYDSARPVTAVRFLLHDQLITGYGPQGPAAGLRAIRGESWVPYQPLSFPTPPFAEHVSGHSSFSAAAAEVLQRYTGSDSFGASYLKPAGAVTIEPGMPPQDVLLSWPTFSAAAEQAGMSRILGGIHFERGNTAGLALGRRVGAQAYTKAERLWKGAA
ncbi:vanadium-dependent haloperoxidase [Massilia sp. BSC265]|uniref:vanadium-dependent haloperoxidase n=1 Tax=Massilia sp. BSC265 TaxID=1549812 RepID=UPI001269C45A|nr:vanadium-dependent haloperoxidase [Massilia sp. BSC265]